MNHQTIVTEPHEQNGLLSTFKDDDFLTILLDGIPLVVTAGELRLLLKRAKEVGEPIRVWILKVQGNLRKNMLPT